MSNDARSSDTPETLVHPKDGGVTYALLIGVDIYLNVTSLWTCSNDVDFFSNWLLRNVCPKEDKNGESTIHCLRFDPELFNPVLKEITNSKYEPRISGDDSLRSVIEKYINTCPFYHIIEDELDLLFEKVTEKDNLIILFSGHGFEVDGDSYLAPADLIVTKNNEYKTKTAISFKDLTNRLNACLAKFKWLIINACRVEVEGAGNCSMRDFGTGGLPQPQGTVILQSCQSKENSIADNEIGLSKFIQALLEALNGGADNDEDGMISMKDVINYVIAKTKEYSGNVQTPCCCSTVDNLENYIVVCKKTEGMTSEQLTKGKELAFKADILYGLAEEQKKTEIARSLLVQASECIQEALKLIPEQPKTTVNPKPGKYEREWGDLDKKINSLKASKEISEAPQSSQKEADSGTVSDYQKIQKDRSRIEEVRHNTPPIQPPIGVNMQTDKRNSRQPQEQNIDPYDENDIQRIKDQKIEPLDNQNSQQNENQRLPLNDDNIQQTNVSKRDIRPSVNQMKNEESDSAR